MRSDRGDRESRKLVRSEARSRIIHIDPVKINGRIGSVEREASRWSYRPNKMNYVGTLHRSNFAYDVLFYKVECMKETKWNIELYH